MELLNKHLYRPSEEVIHENEEYWNAKLPEEYRQMLLIYNGGIPEKRNFKCGERTRMIVRFLCVMDNTDDDYACYDINVVLTEVDERIISNPDMLGFELIPIAELFAGDLLCLDYRESASPSVCVWFHEESEEWQPVTEKVAESFNEFMSMLF